jgi:hypothetical protein
MWDVNLSSSDYEMIRGYINVHREDRREKEKIGSSYIIKNPVGDDEMLDGVLYDGFDERIDEFRYH